jgi:catechol 2,3-dioxygenase-like lactoylglutathione lyase family enzyme
MTMLSNARAYSGLAVHDMQDARRFYAETLGLTTSEEYGLMWLHLAGGRDTLVYEQPDATPASFTILNFEVDDIDATVDMLTARGVRFERYDGMTQDARGVLRAEGPYIAWFKDPSGNVLSVLQEK